jgi:hypothetical protein
MNDNELRELFSEMREDPVPAESLARVRMAVTGRLQSRRRAFGMGWKIGVPLAVAGCLTVAIWRPRTAAPVRAPIAPVAAIEPSVAVEARPPRPVHKRVRAAAKAAAPARHVLPAPPPSGASEIRIENPNDPEVVIVLIGG